LTIVSCRDFNVSRLAKGVFLFALLKRLSRGIPKVGDMQFLSSTARRKMGFFRAKQKGLTESPAGNLNFKTVQ
jgi:hypothetical protein